MSEKALLRSVGSEGFHGPIATMAPRKERLMMRRGRLWLVLSILLICLCSCAGFSFRPVAPGELRLTRLEVPETMQEDLFYDLALSIRTDSIPLMRRVCCRWLSEVPSVAHSSMYWYNYEASSHEPLGSARSRWLDKGPYYDFSAPVCVEGDSIRFVSTDRVVIRFQAKELKPHFNALECYVEHEVNGQLRESNRVSTRINTSE